MEEYKLYEYRCVSTIPYYQETADYDDVVFEEKILADTPEEALCKFLGIEYRKDILLENGDIIKDAYVKKLGDPEFDHWYCDPEDSEEIFDNHIQLVLYESKSASYPHIIIYAEEWR